ncbi:MAG TPA: glycosyltransferase [Actinomycetota bacterium]|nr:glycosyltransferase [Actinomycetota bacterium]
MGPVSVVVPTWRRAPWLDRCLAGLQAQDPSPAEIVVVGRREDEDAQVVVASRASSADIPIRWVEVERPGHVAPVRLGIDTSAGDVVAVVDDDVVPQAGWLAALLDPFSDPSVACVGGRVVTPGQRARVRPDAGQIRWYGHHIGNVAMVRAPEPFDVAGVMECNWAWRRAVLREVRFDPRLDFDDASMYGLDLTLQARERGSRVVYQPAAVVVNEGAPRDPSLARDDRVPRTFTYSRNYSLIASRHLRGLRLPAFWLWWLLIGERGSYGVATAVVDLIAGRTSPAIVTASFKGKFAGVRQWLAG